MARTKEWLEFYLNNPNVIVEVNGVRINFTLLDKVLVKRKVSHRKRNLYYTFLNQLK
jgi:hypothetical protein